jgi:regulator of protease activity HflC (stomatin/prohibitin superfamily)
LLLLGSIGLIVVFGVMQPMLVPVGVSVFVLSCWILTGLVTVEAKTAVVYQFFGKYVGTIREPGFYFASPWYTKKAITIKLQNFESCKSLVTDSTGCPIEIQAVIVWKIADTAKSQFCVDNVEDYVRIQSESAIRSFAALYPYDSDDANVVSLQNNPEIIGDALKNEVADRLLRAGLEVVEARISHLSYSVVVAEQMLKRQQAGAVVAARTQIVTGAIGMVKEAIDQLKEKSVCEISESKKADISINLMCTLVGENGGDF